MRYSRRSFDAKEGGTIYNGCVTTFNGLSLFLYTLLGKKLKMKNIVCCVILLSICVFMQVQGDCLFENETLTVGQHCHNCLQITCKDDGSIFATGCGTWQCPKGKQIGYRELDLSKPCPECCAGPICKDD